MREDRKRNWRCFCFQSLSITLPRKFTRATSVPLTQVQASVPQLQAGVTVECWLWSQAAWVGIHLLVALGSDGPRRQSLIWTAPQNQVAWVWQSWVCRCAARHQVAPGAAVRSVHWLLSGAQQSGSLEHRVSACEEVILVGSGTRSEGTERESAFRPRARQAPG